MSFLVGLDLSDVAAETFNGDNSTTGFTIAAAASTNACAVYVGTARQRPGTDYTVSGTTLTFTTAPPTGTNNILVVYSKIGIINVPADNSVTGGKIDLSLVAGDLIYASGVDTLARLAGGSEGDALVFSSGAPAWGAAGGGWEFVSAQSASGSSTIDFTGLAAGYDFQIQAYGVDNSADADIRFRVGTGGTPTYQTTLYERETFGSANGIMYQGSSGSSSETYIRLNQNAHGGASANEDWSAEITILNPADTGHPTTMFGRQFGYDVAGQCQSHNVGGIWNSATAVTAARLYPASGNFATGEFKLFRRANA